mmetsp:Transcript_44402/g.32467  ORF Transcript_44402/g.32467 Transcript_44402/m.32467 type:complete len:289 (+) Transcript_44402:1648-2514(+)
MVEAEETAKLINENRESYRSVAIRGSVLYFVIADLGLIDPMYQYSLEFFSKLFNRRLEKSGKSEILEERLSILITDITESFYVNICRGLFEKDKLLYSFMNLTSILRRARQIGIDEWNFYLRGSATDFSAYDNDIDYIDVDTFYALMGLEETHVNFKDLILSFKDPGDKILWKEFLEVEEPQTMALPETFEHRLSSFQKLMLLKVLREEKMVNGIKEFVRKELSEKYTESPPFDLLGAFADSAAATPIIFVLSPGADPIGYLLNLAKTKGMDTRLKILSLGQGQGKIA